MPRIGVSGHEGHPERPRAPSGFVRRMMSTAAHTMTNAKSVPMLTSSARMRSGRKAAPMATKTPVRIVDFHGVRNFSWIAPKKLCGTRPSRAIARMTRGWLSIMTSSTEVMPVSAPSEIRNCAHGSPTCRNASETGASMLILSYGTMPVSTAATAM